MLKVVLLIELRRNNMRKINGSLKCESYELQWISLNPYIILGTEPKEFTPKDLLKGEVLFDNNGNYLKIVDFGGGCFFGKDSYSYMMIQIQKLIVKEENPNKYYYSIRTQNPNKDCGGHHFGGWVNSVEECIELFPNNNRTKRCGEYHWHKLQKITNINVLNIETGININLEIKDEYNKQLNSLKYQRNKKTDKKSLEQRLKEAIKKEKYELAAELRDKINNHK